MAKVKSKAAKKKAKRRETLVHRGVVILPPHVLPDTPVPVLRRAVREAVQRHYGEPARRNK